MIEQSEQIKNENPTFRDLGLPEQMLSALE